MDNALILLEQRKAARSDRNWNLADELKRAIEDLGWEILDGADGYSRLVPIGARAEARATARHCQQEAQEKLRMEKRRLFLWARLEANSGSNHLDGAIEGCVVFIFVVPIISNFLFQF
jgi:hypothetical protein